MISLVVSILVAGIVIPWAGLGFFCYLEATEETFSKSWPKKTLLKSSVAMFLYGPGAWIVHLVEVLSNTNGKLKIWLDRVAKDFVEKVIVWLNS